MSTSTIQQEHCNEMFLSFTQKISAILKVEMNFIVQYNRTIILC
uniref:Uncharacterized protein n=1 Tax=Ascaris lumbricoides TaxID=6252 RepID=A0A0M3IID7_ASCLU